MGNESPEENRPVDPAEFLMMWACKTGNFPKFIFFNTPLFSTNTRPSTASRMQTNNNQQGIGTVGPVKEGLLCLSKEHEWPMTETPQQYAQK